MSSLRRAVALFWCFALFAFVASSVHCVNDAGPAVVLDGGVNFEEGGVVYEDGGAAIYKVGGSASGIPSGQTVALTLNGQAPLMIGNGPFSFPGLLAQGQSYVVSLTSMPSGYVCSVSKGMGSVGAADVTDIAVGCASKNAALTSLEISAATLSPAFATGTLAYTAQLRLPGIFPPFTTTTVTATAADPGATITVGGAAATSGTATAPITLKGGVNAIDVTVTAQDGMTKTHYAIAVTGIANEYLKASNTRANAHFAQSISISSDGNTLAVGSPNESSAATGIGGNQADTSAADTGAVYVFARSGATWTQQAYVKASNARAGAMFGTSVALSGDGNTLAVGSPIESSNAVGINGDQTSTAVPYDGAAYVFVRSGATWTQQAYVKSSNTLGGGYLGNFGAAVSLSNDGNTLAVGATGEGSSATGVNNDQTDDSLIRAGAVYVLTRSGTTWTHAAYVKASNTRGEAVFGSAVALSGDGNTLAVGSNNESSAATGIDGNQADTSAMSRGAVYVFAKAAGVWSQQAYVKSSNALYTFGFSVALSTDGSTMAVGGPQESSNATGINGNQNDTSSMLAGATYVFSRSGTTWSQQAYVKPSNTKSFMEFGQSVTLSGDGNSLAVGAQFESSNAKGIGGDQTNNQANASGAEYVFSRTGTTWKQIAYVKASNASQYFGSSSSLSGDGKTLAVGAIDESGGSTGVGGDQSKLTASNSGAVYVF